MNLLGWVVILLAFGTIKYMIYSEYTNDATQPSQLNMPDFPTLNNITSNTFEFHTVPSCNPVLLCINTLAEAVYNFGVIVINVFIVLFNIIKWLIALVVYVYKFIVFAFQLLFFNSFGPDTPWYVKVLVNTPIVFGLGMSLIKLFRSGDDTE